MEQQGEHGGRGPRDWILPLLLIIGVGFVATGGLGCGAISLVHDTMIGPISPAGRVHPLVMGESFRVEDTGPVVLASTRGRLEPIPPEWLRRMSTLVELTRGLELAIASFSFVVEKDRVIGKPLDAADRPRLAKGSSAALVLERLGPPSFWLRREGGSLMAYSATIGHELDLRLGLPPGLSFLIPIPGVSNASFTYASRSLEPRKTLLFFDTQDVLVAVATNEARGP